MLDHLVYLVDDLARGRRHLASLGLVTEDGGRHPRRGTHNALLRTGPRSYLELLAPDPESDLRPPRWMGVDLPPRPRLARWALAAKMIDQPDYDWQSGRRQLPDGGWLRWHLSDPGVEAATRVLPFLIDWSASERHPAEMLPDREVVMGNFRLFHPQPERVSEQLRSLHYEADVRWAEDARIEATLLGPQGMIRLT
jgi:hypothetical protein